VHRRSNIFLLVLSLGSFGLVGCSGLVAGNSGNPPPPSTLVITNIQSGAVTTSSSQVVWTTNIPADSSVDYGTTTAYGNSTPVDSGMVTSHQMTLSGLAAGTTYYYQVNSTDAKGNHGHGGNKFNTGGFSLSGTINPTAAGNGATVALSGAASAATTADNSGSYTFAGLPNGSYMVTPKHTGYAFTPGNQSTTVNGANVSGVNFTATSQTFSISGTISPVAGGSGATVTLSGAASASTAANSSGAYTFAGLASGSYTITPSNAGYTFTPLSQNVTVSATDVSGLNFTDSAVAVAPTITTQPASQTVTAGQSASFSMAVTGTAPLTYQWQKNSVAISGATSSSYTTPATATSDNGALFTVVVSNTAGSVTSTAATLTVNAAPVAPSISTQPSSQTVTAGQAASFSMAATGTAPLSYQWQKNSVAIAGATLSSYTTPATTTADSGSTFRVVVTNTAGTVTSSAATLTVNAAAVAPTISTQPANQTVTVGQTAAFTVVAGGTAPLSYQWQKNSVNITGATSTSYTTPATTTADSGSTFVVVVSNTAGTVTSSAATLTVNVAAVAPAITTQPANQTVTAGQTASFTTAASGTAPLNYQWQKNSVNISGATAASYTTSATTTADGGSTFVVVVSNTAGTVTSSAATLTVNAAAVAPTITTQPANQTVTAGQAATFTVVAGGTAPLSYQWQKNGANISGATLASYTTPATTTADSGSTFAVVVTNTTGTATSAAATLTVNAAAVAPTITTQPANQTVTGGQTAAFTVVAGGTAPLNYQWQKNSVNIAGATSASYTTPATTTADSGSTFAVVVTNTAGTVTSSAATLTVNAAAVAPTITTQPANPTVTAGQAATFTVVAGGTAPLSYQWQKNSVNIAGATSASYTTPATTTSDSGSTFDVVVSNTAGTVTSSAATLTVNAAPVAPSITTQPASQTVAAGQTAFFSVAATGTAPLAYQWQKNSVAISGATSSSYTTPVTTTSDNGAQFTVLVSNTAGSVTSSAASLTVSAAQISVVPTSVSFGNVVTGNTNTQSIQLTNSGTASLTLSQAPVTGNGFSISGLTLPLTLNPGQSTNFNAAFAPAGTGSASGSVSLVGNASNSPLAIPLSGTGVAATFLLGANPTSLGFGPVNVGSNSPLGTTLTNTGNSNVTISSATVTGTGFSASGVTAGATLTPNQSVTLNVTFAPTGAGSLTGGVQVASNATNSPAIIALSGTGVALPPTVAISSPTSGATVSGTITVSGVASDPLGVSSVQVRVDGGTFSLASGTTSWSFSLDTTSLSNAAHTLTARATDTLGTTANTSVSVNVSNSSGSTTLNVKNFGATGNGSTNDTAAINSAIAALQPGYALFFPCGTYLISSGLNAIAVNNVTVYGQTGCSSGQVAIKGTGGGSTIIQVGSQNLTSPTAITATTADLDPTFQANFSAIGAGVGDYVFLSETVSSADTSHTNCGGSGCRGEVLKITGLNGNTATVETAVHNVYDINDVPWAQKVLNPVSGVTVQNLLLDGSGAAMYAVAVLNAVNLNVNNLTLQNVSCSAIAAVNGYNDSYSTITITHAGTNSGCNIGGSAVSLQQQGNLNVNGVSISNMNVGGFGFIPFREANGTFSNISVDGTGTGSGRLFKTNSAAHNVFNNISTNRDEGAYYQGITIEYFSHHNVWNNCKVTNNVTSSGSGANNGINLYGDVANGNHQGSNHYNTFNNCTVTGNNGSAIFVSDNNNNLEINGGTYSAVAGLPVIDIGSPCCAINAYIHNASIGGPGSIGIYIENGSPNACINNNTFAPGLSTSIDVTASSDIGSGNVLNGLFSNLNLGSCGTPPGT